MSSNNLKAALERLSAVVSPVEDTTPRGRFMFYGGSGVGKTVLSVGLLKRIAPPGKRILTIHTAEGFESLKKHGDLVKDVIQVPFTTVSDLSVIAEAIYHNQPPFDNIGGVVFDELSTMVRIHIDRHHQARLAKTPELAAKDDGTPAWPDYHKTLVDIRRMLEHFYEIPGLHVVILAHVGRVKNRQGEIVRYIPSFPERIADTVKENVNLVGYVTAKDKKKGVETYYEREVQVMPTAMYDAKNQISGLDAVRLPVGEVVSTIANWTEAGGKLITATAVVSEPQALPEDTEDEEHRDDADEIETVDIPEASEVEAPALPEIVELTEL